MGYFFFGKIMREIAVEMPLCTYVYNNHHIEVHMESHDDMGCGPPVGPRKPYRLLGYRLD